MIDSTTEHDILTPGDVARYLRKSASWVYKNWQVLGGRKLGGSLFFPKKEELYEHIFTDREAVEVRLHPERTTTHTVRIQDKARGPKGRGEKKGGDFTTTTEGGDPNRHRILGAG